MEDMFSKVKKYVEDELHNIDRGYDPALALERAYGATVFALNYDDVWNYRLKPLLKEYLRGRTDLDEQLIALKAAYDNKNNDAE